MLDALAITTKTAGIRRKPRDLVADAAFASEWKLVCATHNLLKLWRHQQLAAV